MNEIKTKTFNELVSRTTSQHTQRKVKLLHVTENENTICFAIINNYLDEVQAIIYFNCDTKHITRVYILDNSFECEVDIRKDYSPYIDCYTMFLTFRYSIFHNGF